MIIKKGHGRREKKRNQSFKRSINSIDPFIRNNTIPGRPGKLIRQDVLHAKCTLLTMPFLFSALTCLRDKLSEWIPKGQGVDGKAVREAHPSFLSILDRNMWRQLKKDLRRHFEPKSTSIRLFPRVRSGSILSDFALMVLVKCSRCSHTREHCRRWTIRDLPRFLQPHLYFNRCGSSEGYLRAIDPKLEIVAKASLNAVKKDSETSVASYRTPQNS